jgi:hypothetical protein
MPSKLPIRSAKTNYAFVRFAACNSRTPFAFVLLKIIGMGCHSEPPPGSLRRRHTRILHVSPVYVRIGTIRLSNPHYCRDSIDDVSKFLLCPLPFVNVEINPNPTY